MIVLTPSRTDAPHRGYSKAVVLHDVYLDGPAFVLNRWCFENYSISTPGIFVLDDDDVPCDDGIFAVMLSQLTPTTPFVYCDWHNGPCRPNRNLTRKNIRGRFGASGLKLYNWPLLRSIRFFDHTLKHGYDYDACIRLCDVAESDPVFVPERLYLRGDGQFTRNATPERRKEIEWIASRPPVQQQ
jgi:hypothetical protein